ncbi:MAG: winged helix-turn-helix transcriptional regulator [Deltaproteobacteria bacterium]|nr:winged helix-turn-helix transcriptional regulator [Deltaproteobacteria bacterium]
MREIREITDIYKALSDETRIRIVNILQEGKLCVSSIVNILGLRQSTVSRHLSYLRTKGVAESRREGVQVYYSLCSNLGFYLHLPCLKKIREDVEELKYDADRLLQKKRNYMSLDKSYPPASLNVLSYQNITNTSKDIF